MHFLKLSVVLLQIGGSLASPITTSECRVKRSFYNFFMDALHYFGLTGYHAWNTEEGTRASAANGSYGASTDGDSSLSVDMLNAKGRKHARFHGLFAEDWPVSLGTDMFDKVTEGFQVNNGVEDRNHTKPKYWKNNMTDLSDDFKNDDPLPDESDYISDR